MAFTVTTRETGVIGDLAYWIGTLTFDDSYTTGGETFTPANAGLDRFYHLSITCDYVTAGVTIGGYCAWDKSENKIILFESAGANTALTETTAAADRSSAVIYVMALGEHREEK